MNIITGALALTLLGLPVSAQLAAPDTTGNVAPTWSKHPMPDFPARALSQGVEAGEVRLACDTGPNLTPVNCTILSETPEGMGFGPSALAAARKAGLAPDPSVSRDSRSGIGL